MTKLKEEYETKMKNLQSEKDSLSAKIDSESAKVSQLQEEL